MPRPVAPGKAAGGGALQWRGAHPPTRKRRDTCVRGAVRAEGSEAPEGLGGRKRMEGQASGSTEHQGPLRPDSQAACRLQHHS